MKPITRVLMQPLRIIARYFWSFGYSYSDFQNSRNCVRLLRKFARFISKFLWQIQLSSSDAFQLSIYDVYLRQRSQDLTYGYCLYGTYGNFISEEVNGVSIPTVFLDIGANIGLFSLIAQKNDSIMKIYSFEPGSENYGYFLDNIKKNSAWKIVPFPLAISDISGSVHLSYSAKHSGGSHISDDPDSGDTIDSIAVDYVFLDNNCFVAGELVIIKIDVEGHEFQVIQTLMKWRFSKKISKLIIEFDVKNSQIRECESLLKKSGFVEINRFGNSTHWDAIWIRFDSLNL